MFVSMMKWNVLADKADDYAAWAQETIPALLATPGLVEFRGYRPASGAHQVLVTFEFPDATAWAAWNEDDSVQRILAEMREYVSDVNTELWGPSPVVPEPIRPGG